MPHTLITARWLVTPKAESAAATVDVLANGGIVIDDAGIIVAVGPTDELAANVPFAQRLSLPDHILAPGLVNAHCHSAMTLLRGAADDLPLDRWLKERIWPLEGAHDPRSLRASADLGIAELIKGGTTTQKGNPNGHIIRWRETGGDPAATTFAWDIYLFGAEAGAPADVNLSGLTAVNDFSSPDGLWFDQNGLLWIETEKPHIGQIGGMVSRIREVIPNAKLVYNNSPSFNWTLNFRWQVFDEWKAAGKDVSKYNRADLMKVEYDETPLAIEADQLIRTFQADSAKRAGIFHHLITLPTYHTAALSTHELAKGYFGDEGMLAYVAGVQRKEIRGGIACVKHQAMAGSDIGDDHKEIFSGDNALKAGDDSKNTMNQFGG